MRFYILILSIVLLTPTIYGQANDNSQLTKNDYLLKRKNQNTAGAILLLGGVAAFGIALDIDGTFKLNKTPSEIKQGNRAKNWGYVGLACIGASIPLFISARQNKKRAASLSFINQHLNIPSQNGILSNQQLAVSINITY